MNATVTHDSASRLVDQQARGLMNDHFFWGAILAYLPRIYTRQVQTMAVDGVSLYINPDFVPLLTKGAIRTVLAHEASHIVLEHFARLMGRDIRLWNIAGDHVINLPLKDAGFEVPVWTTADGKTHTWLCDESFRSLTTEQAYDRVKREQEAKKPDQPQAGQGQPQAGQGQAGQGQAGQGQPQNGAGQPSQGQGQPQPGQGQPGKGSPGKAQPGKGSPGEAGQAQAGEAGQDQGSQGQGQPQGAPALPKGISDDMGMGGVLPAPDRADNAGMSASDLATIWEVRIRQAARQAEKMKPGSTPGFVKDLLDRLANPKVNWREKVRDFAGTAIALEPSWSRPNRRFLWQGHFLPSCPRNAMSRALFMADSSMSVPQAELKAAFGEAQALLDEGNIESLIWACVDTRVASHGEMFPGDSFQGFHVAGRGGTDFAKPMAWAAEQDVQLIILFTDGEVYNWGADPGIPTLIMGARQHAANLAKCPFGEKLAVDLD